jgi:hypothetical protein
MSDPWSAREPALGASSPAIILKSVDFPHPEGPTIETKEPCSIENEVGATADSAPKDFSVFERVSTGLKSTLSM